MRNAAVPVVALVSLLTPVHFAAVQTSGAEGSTTFHASFDAWPIADVAAGARMPVLTVGSPRLGDGKFGRGLLLDGNSYIEFSPAGNVNGQACTICLWVKLDQWGLKKYDNILGLSDGNQNALHLERADPDGRLRIVFGGPDTADGSKTRNYFSKAPLETGRWYHVAVAWDAGKPLFEYYLDGRLQARDDKPGPFPTQPPVLLVGAGFGRLERSIKGTIDELRIFGQCLSGEAIVRVMNEKPDPSAPSVLTGRAVLARIGADDATVTVGEHPDAGGRFILGPLRPSVDVGGRTYVCQKWQDVTPDQTPSRLGAANSLACTATPVDPSKSGEAAPVCLKLTVQALKEHPAVLLTCNATNTGKETVRISSIALRPPNNQTNAGMLVPAIGVMIFTDSAGLTGSGVHPLSGARDRDHGSNGATVIADGRNDAAFGFSGVSFERTHPHVVIRTSPGGGLRQAEVTCGYPGGWRLAPGETAASETIAFHLPPAGHLPGLAGHAALEHWADLVMGVGNLKPPKFCPCGYNSWYAYRLIISEDLVLANARIIAKRFAPLGCTNFQIDHGWQYKDVCGNWVPNDRFPHGFPWLANELKKMGMTFGLWTAVSQMSEFAPFCREQPEALAKDSQGNPLVTDAHWFWAPHGKCYLVDPTHPKGEAFYEEAGRLARQHGCWYLKNDFQGNLLSGGLNLHDKDIIRGIPVWRKAMAAFARGRGDDMAYHACNAPLNAVAGLCDVAWVHADLGNPRGAWDWLAQFTDQFACRYHVSGKFYWSDPDYLQVGQGDLAETQWRIAMCGLGGGPAYICDRLPDLPEERLAMIPLVLPSYRQVARPIDLFDHEGYARVWHLPIKTAWGQWHVVGLFNLDNTPSTASLRLERLGLDPTRPHLVLDFFSGKPAGILQVPAGLGASLNVPLGPHQTKLLRLTAVGDVPIVAGTDMHVTQGGVELADVTWDQAKGVLSGRALRAPGITGRIFVYVPDGYAPIGGAEPVSPSVVALPMTFVGNEQAWSVEFRRR